MKQYPIHSHEQVALKRIEGQIRGIQKMIDENRYCIDIINQINSANNALLRVRAKIFEKHLVNCVNNALKGRSEAERRIKLNEVFVLINRFRKEGK